jgi:hypothetical protein
MRPRDLDARFLPSAARRAGHSAAAWHRRRGRAQERLQRVQQQGLRDLDDRYARSGPLGFVAELPQLAFVLIAALFVAAVAVAVRQDAVNARSERAPADAVGTSGSDSSQQAGRTFLGPEVGDTTSRYQSAALLTLKKAEGDDDRIALVSLASYLTPEQAVTLVAGVDVRRVYLRAKAAGPQAAQLPVDVKADLLTELKEQYASLVPLRRKAQREFQRYVDTIPGSTKAEVAFKRDYERFAVAAGKEAGAYAANCACVFAIVVSASPERLTELGQRAGVRAVEAAAVDLGLGDVEVLPLLPEVKGVVKKDPARVGAG